MPIDITSPSVEFLREYWLIALQPEWLGGEAATYSQALVGDNGLAVVGWLPEKAYKALARGARRIGSSPLWVLRQPGQRDHISQLLSSEGARRAQEMPLEISVRPACRGWVELSASAEQWGVLPLLWAVRSQRCPHDWGAVDNVTRTVTWVLPEALAEEVLHLVEEGVPVEVADEHGDVAMGNLVLTASSLKIARLPGSADDAPPLVFSCEDGWRYRAPLACHPLAGPIAVAAGVAPGSWRWKQGQAWLKDGTLVVLGNGPEVEIALKDLRARLAADHVPVSLTKLPWSPQPPLPVRRRAAPGWTRPTLSGKRLHAYQKSGALFIAKRDFRCILGDEMGLGKTAQAIAAVEAVGLQKVLVVAPAAARYVWADEIAEWGNGGKVQHVVDTLSPAVATGTRWLIATYDQLIARKVTLSPPKGVDIEQFRSMCSDVPGMALADDGRKLTLSAPVDIVQLEPLDPQLRRALERANIRLANLLVEVILAWGPELIIADEGHKLIHTSTKRHSAVDFLANEANGGRTRLLMLTGTPARNSFADLSPLARLLEPSLVGPDKRLTKAQTKAFIETAMVRRTTGEVAKQLPQVTRQRWPLALTKASHEEQQGYYEAVRYLAWKEAQAERSGSGLGLTGARLQGYVRQQTRGAYSIARHKLGRAKAKEPAVAELVADAVEERGCAAVFAHHLDVIEILGTNIELLGLKVGVVTGQTPPAERAATTRAFNEAELDVFLGGVTVMEAMSLPRAKAAIFVEDDYVPGTVLQAEARLVRPAIGLGGPVLLLHLVATGFAERNLDDEIYSLLLDKLANIREVVPSAGSLDETTPDTRPARFGRKADGSPRRRRPGPGRPSLPPEERQARRKRSKEAWRTRNRSLHAEYTNEWRERKAGPLPSTP